MSRGRLPKYTDFMKNVKLNMATPRFGNPAAKFLTFLLLQLLLMAKFCVYTVDLVLKFERWTKLELLLEHKKFLMRGHSVILFGAIRKMLIHGLCLHEELGGSLGTKCLLRFVSKVK